MSEHAYLMPASHARFTGYHSDIVMHTVAAISASRELRFVQHTVSHFERECGVRFSDPLLIRRVRRFETKNICTYNECAALTM